MTGLGRWTRPGAAVLLAGLLAFVTPRSQPGALLLLVALGAVLLVGSGPARNSGISGGRILLLVTGLGMLAASAPGLASDRTATQLDTTTALAPVVLGLMVAVVVRPGWAMVAAVIGGVLAGPLRALFYDPFLDAECDGCGHGGLVLWPSPVTASLLAVAGILLVIVALVAGLVAGPLGLEMFGLALCLVAYSAGVADGAAVVLASVLGVLSMARRVRTSWLRRRQAQGLVSALDAGRDLTTTLRLALRDPGLVVAFSDLDHHGEVDSSGTEVVRQPGQLTTELLVDGVRLALVHHASSTQVPDLELALDGTARLMLVNEQLTAQLAARVGQLTSARQLVVTRAVAERRALELDLHDGVQQQLLALALDLRLALAEQPTTTGQTEGRLSQALLEVQQAFDDVRDISHGVCPPLLATRGLAAAVASMVRRHGSSVELGELPDRRFPLPVEEAAFAVVAEALTRGAHSLRVVAADDALVMRAEGAGKGVDGVLPDLVSAVGGEVDLTGPTIEAVLPCA